ncbi:hypothetical protein [Cellulomonas cellasea]|uniref:Adhesin domain-containing protein n=1 Tax=Cellulomonas cellasea TaxID=43670 RepID=A0A4Y3KUH1_9CELL|nr:hypothetical protein [Cellulomonas cellasea]GEA86600.1 hypothetical protein CCE01nite_05490 [Cellulomonas cellasea]
MRCSDLATDRYGAVVWQRIDAHLLVDSGSCSLVGVGVHGDATVAAGAELQLVRSSIHGDVDSAGVFRVIAGTVDGDISTSRPPGSRPYVTLDHAHVQGGLTGSASSYVVHDSTVVGAVDVTETEAVSLYFSFLGGSVSARTTVAFASERSTVTGDLSVSGASTLYTRLCTSTVHGDLTLSGAEGPVGLATVDADGHPCPSTVDGSVHVTGSSGDVTIGRLFVKGDLACTGNTGPGGVVLLAGVSVRGTRSGQCA